MIIQIHAKIVSFSETLQPNFYFNFVLKTSCGKINLQSSQRLICNLEASMVAAIETLHSKTSDTFVQFYIAIKKPVSDSSTDNYMQLRLYVP